MPPASRPPAPRPSGPSGTGGSGRGAGRGRSADQSQAARADRRGPRTGDTPVVPRPSGRPGNASGTGPGRSTNRPASGSAPARTPSGAKPRGWARVLSLRSAVLVLVTLMGFILVTPTVLQYLKQRTANDALSAQLEQMKADNEDSENEYNRWQDDKFVIAQARERLTFVFPGETPYRVIDPEVADLPTVDPSPEPLGDGVVTDRLTEGQPWYSTVWESVELAGTAG